MSCCLTLVVTTCSLILMGSYLPTVATSLARGQDEVGHSWSLPLCCGGGERGAGVGEGENTLGKGEIKINEKISLKMNKA